MKVTIRQLTKTFQPVSVTFTLETQKELDALGTLFNHYPTLRALKNISGTPWGGIYSQLAEAGADIHLIEAIDAVR